MSDDPHAVDESAAARAERYRARRRGRSSDDDDVSFDPDAYESIAAYLVDEFLEYRDEPAVPANAEAIVEELGLDEMDAYLRLRADELYRRIDEFNADTPEAAALWAADQLEVMNRVLELEEKRRGTA